MSKIKLSDSFEISDLICCGNCSFFSNNFCEKDTLKTEHNYVCDFWEWDCADFFTRKKERQFS